MRILKPKKIFNSVYDITVPFLQGAGIKGLIFDVDNTLAYNKEAEPCEKIITFLKKMEESGFKIGIASNNNRERISIYCASLGIPYIYMAYKPLTFKLRGLINELGLSARETAFVGDQLFTDILGGNLAGLYTILVMPFDEGENKFIKLKRKLEKRILR